MQNLQDSGGPRAKRGSSTRERCRNEKDRCDPADKKGGMSESYVRGLEKLLGLSISNIDGLEPKILSLLGAKSDDSGNSSAGRRQKTWSLWADGNGSENLREKWRASDLFGELQKLTSAPEADGFASMTTPRSASDNYGLPRSYPTPDSYQSSRIGGAGSDPGISEPPKRKRMRLDSVAEPELKDLTLPPEAPQLLETYFSYTHTWFPVVTKHAILRTSYLYSVQPVRISRTTVGSGDHAALWAILSYITAQSRPHQSPSSSSSTLNQPGFFRDPAARMTEFYTNARNLIPMEEEQFELGHIQALLVLTLVNFGIGDWSAAWMLSGQTTRLAIGLQDKEPSCPAGKQPAGQVNAIVLGCFIVDAILSTRLKASPHMREEDIKVSLLDEDGLEEWGPWSDVLSSCQTDLPGGQATARGPLLSLSCFNRLVELAKLLGRIARQDVSDSATPAFCQSMLRDIDTWREKLPPNCHLGDSDVQGLEKVPPFLLPHQSFLCFIYLGVVSFFHMRFSRYLQLSSSTLEKALQVGTVILAAHARNFGPAVLPPILEHSIRTIIGGAKAASPTRQEDTRHRFSIWVECMNRYTTKTARLWPVMRSLQPELSKELTIPTHDRSWGSALDNPPQTAGANCPRETAASIGIEDSVGSIPPCSVDYNDLFQHDPDEALLDILGLDWNFNPHTDSTAIGDKDITAFPPTNPSSQHQQVPGDIYIPSLDDVLASPGPQLPLSDPGNQPQGLQNTKSPGNNNNHHNPTQLSTPESIFSAPSSASRQPQHASPPPRTEPCIRQKRPAPNEIESIFDDDDNLSDAVTDLREVDQRSPSSHSFHFSVSPGRRMSNALVKDNSRGGDINNSNDNAIASTMVNMDLDNLPDPLNMEVPLRSKSRSASAGAVLAPPSIGDLWPPPGFFPSEDEKRAEDRGGKR